MGFLVVVGFLMVVGASGEEVARSYNHVDVHSDVNEDIARTELVQASVIFRHGDRTPDDEEIALGKDIPNNDIFFPYGKKALTNKGKQRAFAVGKYLRKRYDGLVSQLYLPNEISIRTTSYARTKMTALAALAGLYPPPPAQRWNPALNWQPVPYDTPEAIRDDLLYWYYCPLYLKLRNDVYDIPEVAELIRPHIELFEYLSKETGKNISTPEAVFLLDSLFQTLNNVGIKTPDYAQARLPEIKEVTKLEFAAEYYTPKLIRLSSGVLLQEILNATSSYINGSTDQPKLRLYSAHENNVAALMSAARVFEPHQPNYGATFSLELRRNKITGQYFIMAVYAKDAGGPAKILTVRGCGSELCEYDKFFSLVKDYAWSLSEFFSECQINVDDC